MPRYLGAGPDMLGAAGEVLVPALAELPLCDAGVTPSPSWVAGESPSMENTYKVPPCAGNPAIDLSARTVAAPPMPL